ncbi:MAG: stage III sporulation protein AG [Oscillospiraceae bacterium]
MKDKTEKKQFKLPGLLKNKYALIVLAVGLVLVLFPSRTEGTEKETRDLDAPSFSIKDEEARLEKQLCIIRGAGRVSALLSVKGSASRELADSGEETLVVSSNGKERVVELYYVNPQYLGAVIVCDGAEKADVRLEVTKAVCAFTGLPSDKVMVMPMS